jgi:phosphoribosylanthranilate isomerase
VIPENRIAAIVDALDSTVESFLLTSRQSALAIIDQHRRLQTTTIQLCDRLEAAEWIKLRASLPGVRLVQVIHVEDEQAVAEARSVAALADALLLDSGKPGLPTKVLGGTGKAHDWQLSKRIRTAVDIPVYLAGGLHSGNVPEAIRTVRPHGVDVCSGVRTGGRLDEHKLAAFVQAARSVGAIDVL